MLNMFNQNKTVTTETEETAKAIPKSQESQKVIEKDVTRLRHMRALIADLRTGRISLDCFIHNQWTFIVLLIKLKPIWKNEYISLVMQIDKVTTEVAQRHQLSMNEEQTLMIERSIKAMEFLLSMAEQDMIYL